MWAAHIPAGPSKAKARLALIRGEGPACPRRCYLHLPSWAPLVFGRVDRAERYIRKPRSLEAAGAEWAALGTGAGTQGCLVWEGGESRLHPGLTRVVGSVVFPGRVPPPEKCGSRWPPGELGPCEQTCREPNATETQGSCSAGQAPRDPGACTPLRVLAPRAPPPGDTTALHAP